MTPKIFEDFALRRVLRAYDEYLTRQLKLPADRRDSLEAAATRFRHLLRAEMEEIGG